MNGKSLLSRNPAVHTPYNTTQHNTITNNIIILLFVGGGYGG